jgi:hypothetical protein
MMQRRSLAFAALCLAVVVLLPGCTSRVSFDKTLTLEPGAIKMYTIDAPRREQKVRIQVDSREPVTCYVGLADAAGEMQKALERDAQPTALGGKSGVTQESFDVSIAAGKEFVIFLSGAKKPSEVKLSVKSL